MNEAYIALGSNIEPREEYLQKALQLLQKHEQLEIRDQSSIYETEPVGYTNQNAFLNMVVYVHTELSSLELLHYCQSIETALGRKRTIRFGPRTVDLDILLYNQESVSTDELTLPHPRMHMRAFVLVPLAEINNRIEINGYTVSELLSNLGEDDSRGVKKWR